MIESRFARTLFCRPGPPTLTHQIQPASESSLNSGRWHRVTDRDPGRGRVCHQSNLKYNPIRSPSNLHSKAPAVINFRLSIIHPSRAAPPSQTIFFSFAGLTRRLSPLASNLKSSRHRILTRSVAPGHPSALATHRDRGHPSKFSSIEFQVCLSII